MAAVMEMQTEAATRAAARVAVPMEAAWEGMAERTAVERAEATVVTEANP